MMRETDFSEVLRNKKVFITGHTGFTGSWISIWLEKIGAEIFGFALPPVTTPNLFTEAGLDKRISGTLADIRDFEALCDSMLNFQPDLVLHLAAQPLVRSSYEFPRETFDVNTQGTANLLEAARRTPSVRGVLCITTDKVYKNIEANYKYKESDRLGGKDPYSASKAAAELIVASYRDSFYEKSSARLAVARGGNIIGGGDWSEDRLIPDFMKAYETAKPITIRNPEATRPWQHVLALAEGYLTILAGLVGPNAEKFSQCFNLGPLEIESFSVQQVLTELSRQMPGVKIEFKESEVAESIKLALDSSLASSTFGWNPRWSTSQVIEKTADWYKAHFAGNSTAYDLCVEQIDSWKDSTPSTEREK